MIRMISIHCMCIHQNEGEREKRERDQEREWWPLDSDRLYRNTIAYVIIRMITWIRVFIRIIVYSWARQHNEKRHVFVYKPFPKRILSESMYLAYQPQISNECIAVCCSASQCCIVCCSMLQCVTRCETALPETQREETHTGRPRHTWCLVFAALCPHTTRILCCWFADRDIQGKRSHESFAPLMRIVTLM